MKIKFSSVMASALCVLGLATLSPSTGFATPLTSGQVDGYLDGYRTLLRQIATEPRTPNQSLFQNPRILSEADIDEGSESLRAALNTMSSPELIANRLETLDLIRRHQPILPIEAELIKREIEDLSSLMRFTLCDWDKNYYRNTCFLGCLGGFLTACAGLSLHLALEPTDQPWVFPTYLSLYGSGYAAMQASGWLIRQFRPDRCIDVQLWGGQFSTFGQKVAARLKSRSGPPSDHLTYVQGQFRQLFPEIPLYLEILDWVSSQPQFLQIPDPLQNPIAQPSSVDVYILMEEAAQDHPPSPEANRILEAYRTQEISRWTFSQLEPETFRESIQWIAHEIKKQPYSLWNNFSAYRLLMLALNRGDSKAVLELINSQRSPLALILGYEQSIYHLTFLLAVKQNNAELLQLLLRARTEYWPLKLEHAVMKEGIKIASSPNHAEVLEILQRSR